MFSYVLTNALLLLQKVRTRFVATEKKEVTHVLQIPDSGGTRIIKSCRAILVDAQLLIRSSQA